jgi:hypothetical protein
MKRIMRQVQAGQKGADTISMLSYSHGHWAPRSSPEPDEQAALYYLRIAPRLPTTVPAYD